MKEKESINFNDLISDANLKNKKNINIKKDKKEITSNEESKIIRENNDEKCLIMIEKEKINVKDFFILMYKRLSLFLASIIIILMIVNMFTIFPFSPSILILSILLLICLYRLRKYSKEKQNQISDIEKFIKIKNKKIIMLYKVLMKF